MGIFNKNKSDDDIFSDLLFDQAPAKKVLAPNSDDSHHSDDNNDAIIDDYDYYNTAYNDTGHAPLEESGFYQDPAENELTTPPQPLLSLEEQSAEFMEYLADEPMLPIEEHNQMPAKYANQTDTHLNSNSSHPAYPDINTHNTRQASIMSLQHQPHYTSNDTLRSENHSNKIQTSHERNPLMARHENRQIMPSQKLPGERQLLSDSVLQSQLRNPFEQEQSKHNSTDKIDGQGSMAQENNAPAAETLHASLSNEKKTDYGINAAIELVRQLPDTGDLTVLMKVVKKTLETTGINTADIINDANHKKATIDIRMKKLKDQIHSLEAEIRTHSLQMETLVRDFRETEQVQELLELAEMPQPTKFSRGQKPNQEV